MTLTVQDASGAVVLTVDGATGDGEVRARTLLRGSRRPRLRLQHQRGEEACRPASGCRGTFVDVNACGSNAVAHFEGESIDKRRVSDHLVRGVDFLFALTLGQGVLLFRAFWTDPLHLRYAPVALALGAVYITTFLSFIDWHLAMEQRPYLVTWDITYGERLRERLRVFIDLIIVILYAYLLVNATVLIDDPGHSVSHFLIGFPLIFVFYTVWGLLRRNRYPAASTRTLWVLGSFTVVFVAIYAVYTATRSSGKASNEIVLAVVIAAVLLYRVINGLFHRANL